MDLQQIKYFLAVVDLGTFMAAADYVHVSQPTLSAGVQNLEQSLGVQLFNRGSRSSKLTPAGELFLNNVRPAYNQLLSAKSKLSIEQERINLGILNSIPIDHVSEIISLYRATQPHVLIEVTVGNDEELLELLKSKKIDIAITGKKRSSKKFTQLFNEALMVAVPAQHQYAKLKNIELKQIDEQPFVERINCESWDVVHTEFLKKNINPQIVCRAESDNSVLSLVSANLGISIMPERNTPYAVTFVPIKDLHVVRHIGLIVSSSSLSQHVQMFYETALNKFNK